MINLHFWENSSRVQSNFYIFALFNTIIQIYQIKTLMYFLSFEL